MNRRVFMGHLGLGTLAAAGTAVAQPAPKVARIGILGFAGTTAEMAGPEARRPSVRAFLQRMRELGYVYGRDFVTEPRGGEGRPELWAGQAADLVRLNVDVIVAPGPNLASLQRSTSVIPVVMAASSDPVGEGFVRSLRHPGGNITGLSLQEVDTSGKRLELLEGLLPEAAPVALLWTNPFASLLGVPFRCTAAYSRRLGRVTGASLDSELGVGNGDSPCTTSGSVTGILR